MGSTSRRQAPGRNEYAQLLATTRRRGGALATSYIACVSAILQRNIGILGSVRIIPVHHPTSRPEEPQPPERRWRRKRRRRAPNHPRLVTPLRIILPTSIHPTRSHAASPSIPPANPNLRVRRGGDAVGSELLLV